ncbi:MAG: histidine phosphatase family protein [Candidatus Gracilibacteria bacterium]|nr:histidine phosphatase family protein [Candidatus Gracilibacteria bacterium]
MNEFRELNFGYFEGKRAELIRNLQPEIYDENDFFRYDIKLLGGESILDLKKRVESGLKKLCSVNKNILLITHGSVIHMIYSILGNIDYNQSYSGIDIDFDKVHYFKL